MRLPSTASLGPLSLPPLLPQCNQTFLDAIGGGDTWLFRQGLQLAGYADKLPSPELGVTVLVPSNGAWWNFLWRNGFLLGQLGDLGDKLLSVMTFHIMPTALTPDNIAATPEGAGQGGSRACGV